uniref:Nuclear pore complex protein Nup50 n=1 Tax=Nomascus leucogenys TaxID=61853 RepID=A0A2I3H938_NOMLE
PASRAKCREGTDRNWDQEDEAEEMGTFSVASEEVLKNRAIKKAKRRNVGFESDSGGDFKDFKGLVVPSGGGRFPGFGSGLSNGNNITSAPPFTGAKAVAEPKVAFGSLAANGPTALVDKKVSNPKTNGDCQQPSSSACVGNACHKQLAALNCSVRDWIVKHVNTNPLCDLTPIFKDYEKYLANIEQQHGNNGRNSESESNKAAAETQSPSLFGSTKLQQESTFLFHENGPIITRSDKCQAEGDSGECKEKNDEPPKVVVTEVKEEDAFYSKKCKLFYKKDNEFKEKGIGTLHLKPTANQKTQLLVRADTNLGNILLNVLIPPNMPCTRTGKNNVLIVCVPNPPIDEKNATIPVTMLIRVETSEDADELHKILLEKKDA